MQRIVKELSLANGVNLQIVHGDLTAEETDAIVNAANERLQHGGGVAGAISRKGGVSIQEESDRIGFVHTGEAAATGAGTLPASFVIHAVGPVWKDGSENEDALLEGAVRSALNLAAKMQLESIALPAISSGIFGFPKDRCAGIILRTIAAFAAAGESSLRLVRCTNIDEETVSAFKQAAIAFE
ncbi:MAG: macrodomain protein [Ectothiorhodospiraceae bacterium]|nr:macrodomain protein [Ectothiorhodospiraceae bacterium]